MTAATALDRDHAIIGRGDDKDGEAVAARELYTSNHFGKPWEFAEEVCDGWTILSVKHGVVDPDKVLEPYDVTAEDVDPDAYVDCIADELAAYAGWEWKSKGAVWVLVGQPYLEDESGRTVRDVVSKEV